MEGRKARRKKLTTEVIFIANGSFHYGYSRDISAKDIFVETHDVYPAGTELLIDFYLPGAPIKFKVKGRVVRIEKGDDGKKSGMGIEFIEVSPYQKSYLERYIGE